MNHGVHDDDDDDDGGGDNDDDDGGHGGGGDNDDDDDDDGRDGGGRGECWLVRCLADDRPEAVMLYNEADDEEDAEAPTELGEKQGAQASGEGGVKGQGN